MTLPLPHLMDLSKSNSNHNQFSTKLAPNEQPYPQDTLLHDTYLKDAYLTLPRHIREALLDNSRVIFVANNPSISTSDLDQTLQKGDIVVLFNHFIQAEYFAHSPLAAQLTKLLFFRQIGDSRIHFGLPPRHNNITIIEQMLKDNKVGFLFGNDRYHFPTLADDPSPDDDPIDDTVTLELSDSLSAAIENAHYSSILPDTHLVVTDYPIYEHIHSSAPSSGFLIYRLMLAIKTYLLQYHGHQLQLALLGFNDDEKTDYFWSGHNWVFERQETANPPEGVTLIKVG